MSEYKILISGPVGVGKSTAVRALSSIDVVSTDEKASDQTSKQKETTTVALDYGVYHIGNGERVHLYGTPGQERFSFMWDILGKGACGLIILIDNTRKNPLQDLEYYIEAFKPYMQNLSVILGVTRMDLSPSPSLDVFKQELNRHSLDIEIFEIDSRERDDVLKVVQGVVDQLKQFRAGTKGVA